MEVHGAAGDDDFYSISAGVNWFPTNNPTLRPEVCFDWFNDDSGQGILPFDDGRDDSQVLLGLDAFLLI